MAAWGRGLFSLYIYIENLKNLLVRNHQTDFNIILQKCSFGDPRPRLFKPFGFVKKHGCQGAGLIFPKYQYRKLKKSSCLKPLDRFPYNFCRNVPLVTLYQDCSSHLDLSKNMATRGRGSFSLYIYIENLKKSSCQKPLDQLLFNFAEIFLCDSVPRLFKPFGLSKNMAARGWGLFSLYIFIENLKNLLVRNHWTNFIITWQKCFHGDPVPRLFK